MALQVIGYLADDLHLIGVTLLEDRAEIAVEKKFGEGSPACICGMTGIRLYSDETGA